MRTAQAAALDRPRAGGLARAGDYLTLAKPRIVGMVLLTTVAGFLLGSEGGFAGALLLHTLAGTAMAAAGGAALNMFLERDLDALMRRTENRPLPAGRLHPAEALLLGVALSVSGVLYLAAAVGALASGLALATLLVYLAAYTPMKTRSDLAVAVGAVSGALPPLIGFAAARGALAPEALVPAGILFFWQMPHFLSLAWIYRADYARAGIRVPPVADPGGRTTGRRAVAHAAMLLLVTLSPALLSPAAVGAYFPWAPLVSVAFLAAAVRFAVRRADGPARALFVASLLYLPLVLGLFLLERSHP